MKIWVLPEPASTPLFLAPGRESGERRAESAEVGRVTPCAPSLLSALLSLLSSLFSLLSSSRAGWEEQVEAGRKSGAGDDSARLSSTRMVVVPTAMTGLPVRLAWLILRALSSLNS